MASENFERALAHVLAHEGGFVDHPDDPGGRTNKGVTQAVYDAWREARDCRKRSVEKIEDDEIEAIYREGYWDAVCGDELPPGVDYCVFDASVNSGPAQAARWLQRAAGAAVDGVIGPRTLAAAARIQATQAASRLFLIEAVCARRLAFLKALNTWPVFGRGWARRIEEVRRAALVLAEKR